jgi:isopenicillin-N epimerase
MLEDLFLLDPEITFLNFGSFGACPKEIFDDYQQWQLRLEREPVQFIIRDGYEFLDLSRKALSDYIGCAYDDIIFTTNPTYAINTIVNSLPLQTGDEILTTDLEYGAMDRTWEYHALRKGWTYKKASIPLPIQSKQSFLEAFWQGFNSKTKVVFISQITSSTGLILPVEEVCKEAKARGLITIVDGAHVPGHIPLNLAELEADLYTGACHKWMMTPKGCSFMYASKPFQEMLDPLVISWGYKSDTPSGSLYFDYHQFNGTRDFSAFLTIPASMHFREKYDWESVSARCRELVQSNVQRTATFFQTEPLSADLALYGQMCSTPIQCANPAFLQRELFERFKIEIPIMQHNGQSYIRFSIQAFNTESQIDALFDSMDHLKNLWG